MADAPRTEMLDVSKLTGDTLEVVLVVVVPGVGEKRYPMRQASMRAGRAEQSDIVVKEPSVSSRHCEFYLDGGRVFVKDLGSSNGTYFSDERIQERELKTGDVVRIGNASTITVQIARGGGLPAAEPAGGSTAMISADDLNAMRAGRMPAAPAPRAAPAPPPPPRPAPMPQPVFVPEQEEGGGKKALLIGVGVGVGVLVIGVVVVLFLLASGKKKEDRETIALLKTDIASLTQGVPCTAAQESVGALAKLSQSEGSPPRLPAKAKDRAVAMRFADTQAEKARLAKRAASAVESYLLPTAPLVERMKTEVGKLHNENLRIEGAKLLGLVEERMQLTQDFVGQWSRLETEAKRYANHIEGAWVKGSEADADAFDKFRFTVKPAPILVNGCKSNHEAKNKEITDKLAELEKAAP